MSNSEKLKEIMKIVMEWDDLKITSYDAISRIKKIIG